MRRALPLLAAACGPTWTRDPDEARLVTDDLPRFYDAVDDGADADAFDARYLAAATPGLRAFRDRRFRDAPTLADAYATWRPWYDAVRPVALALHAEEAWKTEVRAAFRAAADAWPEAFFPDTTFVVGAFTSGGTTDPGAGLLVGAEFFAPADGGPTEALDAWRRDAVRPASEVAVMVSHEHVHLLQADRCPGPGDTDPLLAWVLLEGGADFLAARWAGAPSADAARTWLLANEAEAWAEIRPELDGPLGDRWLYDGGSVVGRPADVGYAIGARIVEAWWAQSSQDAEAVAAVLDAPCDADAFLEASGYDPGAASVP